MKFTIQSRQKPINILPDQILTRIPQHFINITRNADNLAAAMIDVVDDIDRAIDHNEVLIGGEFHLVVGTD